MVLVSHNFGTRIYPRIERIREISTRIAIDVIAEARKAGVATNRALNTIQPDQAEKWVSGHMWVPKL